MQEITKIVITGGPCGGKTTAISWIQDSFTQKGYTVLFVPETATELIIGGISPWTCSSNAAFQTCLFQLQLSKEAVYLRAAKSMKSDKILIVCDRGILDNKAYMTPEEFQAVLREVGRDEDELRDSYDAVFHLTTAAKGAVNAYTLSNNAARTETPEQAIAVDDKLIEAWAGHPHLRIIDNSTDFENKMRRLMDEISLLTGHGDQASS